MDFSYVASEDKIRKAYEDGEFKALPGLGKPLVLEDLSAIPQELRMAYKMLKNGGYDPEEVKLKSEIKTIEDLIEVSKDEHQIGLFRKQLNEKTIRLNSIIKKRQINNSSAFKDYGNKIYDRLK
ncbi:DnaJ family domain-containing protein [Bacillus sp. AK128]